MSTVISQETAVEASEVEVVLSSTETQGRDAEILKCGALIGDAMTLRNARQLYCTLRGIPIPNGKPPELRTLGKGDEMYPMTRPRLTPEVAHRDDMTESVVLYTGEIRSASLELMRDEVRRLSHRALRPWVMLPLVKYTRLPKSWSSGVELVRGEAGEILDVFVSSNKVPISIYTHDACIEASVDPSSLYASIYRQMKTLEVYNGLFGVMHMNQVVNMNVEDNPLTPSIPMRKPLPEHKYFLCAGYTPHSAEAGQVRRVAHGVEVRMTSGHNVSLLLELVDVKSGGDYATIWLHGLYMNVSKEYVKRLINRVKSGTYGPLTFHAYRSRSRLIIRVSIMSGVLIRRLGRMYVDNVMANDPTTSSLFGIQVEPKVENLFSTYFMFVPFLRYDRPPRTLISSVQAVQAICYPRVIRSYSYWPKTTLVPLVTTRFVRDTLGVSEDLHYIPGHNALMCLANFNDNYEDCMMVSSASVKNGMLSYREVCTMSLGERVDIKPKDKITMKDHEWWTVPTSATVISTSFNIQGETVVTLERESQLMDGDKLSTQHGQKGIVKIIDSEHMPVGIKDDGEEVHFDIIMSVSSVVSRVTVGQILELSAGLEAHTSGRTVCSEDYIERNDGPKVTARPVRLKLPGRDGFIRRLSSDGEADVRADWGYARVWLLSHLTADKHHFTRRRSGAKTKQAPGGRTGGGSVKLGEMEIHAMASVGLTRTLQEFTLRRDMMTCRVCCGCNRITYLCDCPGDAPARSMLIPYATVCLDMVHAITESRSFNYM